MKRKRFMVEQMVAVVKKVDVGAPVADVIRKVSITEQTFYRWKKQYHGLESEQERATFQHPGTYPAPLENESTDKT